MKLNSSNLIMTMYPTIKAIPLIVFLNLGWCACESPSIGQNPQQNKSKYSMEIDIPKNRNGEPVPDYRIIKEFQMRVGLDSLEKGYDSLQIRIWGGHSQALQFFLVKISRTKKEWHGELITLNYMIDPESPTFRYRDKLSRTVTPRSGWEAFEKKLFDLQITSLPDMSQLGYEGGEDGTSYMVELATSKYYRFYSYWSPEVYQNKYPAAKSMKSITQLLQAELGFIFY